MSELDASIPLSVKPTEFMSPSQVISLQGMVQQMQAQKLQQAQTLQSITKQNQIQQRLSQPGAMDGSGLFTPQALSDITKLDASTGIHLTGQVQHVRDEQAAAHSRQLQDQTNRLQLAEKLQKSQNEVLESAVSFVDTTMPNASQDEKDRAVSMKVQETLDRQQKSGLYDYTEDQWANLKKYKYTYGDAKARVTPLKEVRAEKKLEDAEKKQAAKEAKDASMPLSDIGKIRADEKAGKITHKDAEAMVNKREGIVPTAVTNDLKGEDYIKSLPTQEQGLVKAIAEGKIDPKTLSTKGGHREKILQQVTQYKPDYNQQDYGQTDVAIKAYGTGKQGQSVRAFNVALEHLETLKELGDALENKDLQGVNKLANMWKTQTGDSGPTSFDGAKQLVADEVVKAIVGSGGGVHDREEAAKTISAASSPAQLNGIIETYKHLFGGQLKGLEEQYKASTKRNDFRERYLTDRGREAADKGYDVPEVKPMKKDKVDNKHELEFDDPEKEKRYQQWKKANGK